MKKIEESQTPDKLSLENQFGTTQKERECNLIIFFFCLQNLLKQNEMTNELTTLEIGTSISFYNFVIEYDGQYEAT